jgi:hypothetical protein
VPARGCVDDAASQQQRCGRLHKVRRHMSNQRVPGHRYSTRKATVDRLPDFDVVIGRVNARLPD